MMLANIPAVILGDRLAGKLPVKDIRLIAVVFALLGIARLEQRFGESEVRLTDERRGLNTTAAVSGPG